MLHAALAGSGEAKTALYAIRRLRDRCEEEAAA
jgi:hypothetical protein